MANEVVVDAAELHRLGIVAPEALDQRLDRIVEVEDQAARWVSRIMLSSQLLAVNKSSRSYELAAVRLQRIMARQHLETL